MVLPVDRKVCLLIPIMIVSNGINCRSNFQCTEISDTLKSFISYWYLNIKFLAIRNVDDIFGTKLADVICTKASDTFSGNEEN